jgi:hypothetical protein
MFKSLMAQIFTFSEIPEELWSQATELAERLLRHQKESGPRPNSTRSSRFTTSFPCCATRPRWRWIRRPGCPGTTPQPPRSQCSLLPPAPSDLAAPAAKARASGKLVRFGTVMRQGCEPRCQIDACLAGAHILGVAVLESLSVKSFKEPHLRHHTFARTCQVLGKFLRALAPSYLRQFLGKFLPNSCFHLF